MTIDHTHKQSYNKTHYNVYIVRDALLDTVVFLRNKNYLL